MKSDTVAVILKGTAAVGMAVCLQLANSLSQWANTGEWPAKINWVVSISITAAAGFNALSSFMSGTYTAWRADRKAVADAKRVALTQNQP